MAVVIIILAFLLVLGSMLWVLPSPRERRQMVLRRKAMSMGLAVQLAKTDDPDHPGEQRRCTAYRLANPAERKPSLRILVSRSAAEPSGGTWNVEQTMQAANPEQVNKLTLLLDKLPADCFAVELAPAAVSIYWNERGEEADVAVVYAVLQDLQGM